MVVNRIRGMRMIKEPLAIIILGASGDLAQRKLLPALFSLYAQKLLPENFHVFGFARSEMTDAAFRARATERLMCRYTPEARECATLMEQFLARCHYVGGDYGSSDAFRHLADVLRGEFGTLNVNRLFYLAIPPSVFLDAAHALNTSGLVSHDSHKGWTRVVIEKPFGHDRASSDELVTALGQVFTDEQTYRIDHYLGKEIIQNLLVLRFANCIFEPLWSREFVSDVRITWKEDIGIGGRAGYFDDFGIIRDVMQNHILQMLALTAMGRPDKLDAHHVRDEKVHVLRAIQPLAPEDLVVGQYAAAEQGAGGRPAYRGEPGVPPTSRTPTYAAAVLRVKNDRWRGVPFLVECGKALNGTLAEIRLRFRDEVGNLFHPGTPTLSPNELVIRVQPDEAIFLRINNKVPGLGMKLAPTELNLRYRAAFAGVIPEAYESLLLDVVKGDKSLFIRADELAASWDVFDHVLHDLETHPREPEFYAYGSRGPRSVAHLAERHGIELETGA
ncbi:MAG: glucose-6-phosphate dehydrogenase [Verrucomicrobia bacterium]|nr:MAG: glucose-6-phosphate dehydrogenase [Verrucomicrobiota bacterium]